MLLHVLPRKFSFFGKIGFSLWLPVANARGELQIYRPANVMEWYAVGPQPAYKTFEDILIVLLGSIEVNNRRHGGMDDVEHSPPIRFPFSTTSLWQDLPTQFSVRSICKLPCLLIRFRWRSLSPYRQDLINPPSRWSANSY